MDVIFSNDLRPAEIKKELICYFVALETGYRDKVN